MGAKQSPFEHVYNLFFKPGEVVELRALGVGGKNANLYEGWARQESGVFGYFDSGPALADGASRLDALRQDPPDGIYFTINPPRPAVMARAANRLVAATRKRPCTSDHEIACYRWLPIDLDVGKGLKPAGVSSSEEEMALARTAGQLLLEYLAEKMGFPDPVKAMSGNGYHLNYRLDDLPADKETQALVKKALQALHHILSTDLGVVDVDVDLAVHNPSRIWKLYGTLARKGDDTPERPHRRSHLFKDAPAKLAQVPVLPLAKLKALADLAPAAPERAPVPARTRPMSAKTRPMTTNALGKVNLPLYLASYGIPYRLEAKNGADWYILEACVFDESHKGRDAAIVQSSSGQLTYHCFHNSCQSYTWQDVRQQISGTDKIAKFCENYNPDWQPSKACGQALLTDVALELPWRRKSSEAVIFVQDKEIPPPAEIDPDNFFQMKGKREKFCVQYMVLYLALRLQPIAHTDGIFYHYTGGVWRVLPPAAIRHMAAVALKERLQVGWVNDALNGLADLVHRPEEDWQPPGHLINVLNGMFDVTRGELVPHDPAYASRMQLQSNYDPEAIAHKDGESPRWETFLREIFPETDVDGKWLGIDKVTLLQEFFGYVLLPTCKYERCMFMYGTGANGKSTVINALQHVIGEEHCRAINIDDLANRFNLPKFQHTVLNVAAEAVAKNNDAVQTLKRFISGDTIDGEWKYGEQVSFRPRTKFIFALNSPPGISDKSHGLQRKLLVLDFNRRFEEWEQDKDLDAVLKTERDAIFYWALEGAMRLQHQGGFYTSELIESAKEHFVGRIVNVIPFVEECCVVSPNNPEARVPTDDVYRAYCKWCHAGNQKPLGRPNFNGALLNQFPELVQIKGKWEDGRRQCFRGLELREEYQPDNDLMPPAAAYDD